MNYQEREYGDALTEAMSALYAGVHNARDALEISCQSAMDVLRKAGATPEVYLNLRTEAELGIEDAIRDCDDILKAAYDCLAVYCEEYGK